MTDETRTLSPAWDDMLLYLRALAILDRAEAEAEQVRHWLESGNDEAFFAHQERVTRETLHLDDADPFEPSRGTVG
jgi:hypothetical protein